MKLRLSPKFIGTALCLTVAALVVKAQLNVSESESLIFVLPADLPARGSTGDFADAVNAGGSGALAFDQTYPRLLAPEESLDLASSAERALRAAEIDQPLNIAFSIGKPNGFVAASSSAVSFALMGGQWTGAHSEAANAWTDVNGSVFETATTAPAWGFRFETPRLSSWLPPASFAVVGALALAALVGIRRIQYHSVALAG